MAEVAGRDGKIRTIGQHYENRGNGESNNRVNLRIVDCNSTTLKQVEVFKHLGVIISEEGG